MTESWWRRFLVRGVFWRQFLGFAVLNVPIWIEPVAIATWTLVFLLWPSVRRGVMINLKAIKPGSSAVANLIRTYRVFWNFAWTITDTVRFKETRTVPDWEFVGQEYFEQMLAREGGSILLTAHMGSYDLGAHLFAQTSSRRIVMVRAPETDRQTREYEEKLHERTGGDMMSIGFSNTNLAFDLLESIQRGEIVAIQGDRVTPGVAFYETSLLGMKTKMPAGPFALAMATRAPIYPVFVIRLGRRCYRLLSCAPIAVERTGRDRDADLQAAIDRWAATLEDVIRNAWHQWFTFEPFSEELPA